jgi:hypothetical protein
MSVSADVFLRAARAFGRPVAWCAAVTVPLLAAGCGGGSSGVTTSTGTPVQDSMTMTAAQTANFMAILGATLARSGLATRAECCASIS